MNLDYITYVLNLGGELPQSGLIETINFFILSLKFNSAGPTVKANLATA